MDHDSADGPRLVVAVFADRDVARATLERLLDKDFPMDSVSLLGKGETSGDDSIGIYYKGLGERIKVWGAQGAFWGGLWGLLAGAAGMFVIPGLGAVLAAGPIVEAIAAALAGAAVSGSAMAGAAAVSQLAIALHRMGIPHERLQYFHDAIQQGHYIIMLRCGNAQEAEHWRAELAWHHAENTESFPWLPDF